MIWNRNRENYIQDRQNVINRRYTTSPSIENRKQITLNAIFTTLKMFGASQEQDVGYAKGSFRIKFNVNVLLR